MWACDLRLHTRIDKQIHFPILVWKCIFSTTSSVFQNVIPFWFHAHYLLLLLFDVVKFTTTSFICLILPSTIYLYNFPLFFIFQQRSANNTTHTTAVLVYLFFSFFIIITFISFNFYLNFFFFQFIYYYLVIDRATTSHYYIFLVFFITSQHYWLHLNSNKESKCMNITFLLLQITTSCYSQLKALLFYISASSQH